MKNRGFTLIEILIGIALLAILLALVIAAINPARRFREARDTQRWSDVTAVMDAINLNMLANNGVFECPDGTTYTFQSLENASSTIKNGAGYTDLCTCLVTDGFIGSMPYDPSDGSFTSCGSYDTAYRVWQSTSTLVITVKAPGVEEPGGAIQVSR